MAYLVCGWRFRRSRGLSLAKLEIEIPGSSANSGCSASPSQFAAWSSIFEAGNLRKHIGQSCCSSGVHGEAPFFSCNTIRATVRSTINANNGPLLFLATLPFNAPQNLCCCCYMYRIHQKACPCAATPHFETDMGWRKWNMLKVGVWAMNITMAHVAHRKWPLWPMCIQHIGNHGNNSLMWSGNEPWTDTLTIANH